jgi:signal transduction histidine kinase
MSSKDGQVKKMEEQGSKTFGIAKKLFAYFLVLSLLPILIGGIIFFHITKNKCEEKTRAHLSDLTRDCGNKISYYVSARYQDIRILSLTEAFKGKNRQAVQAYIDGVHAVCPFYQAIAVLDPEGTIIACTFKKLVGESRAKTDWFQRVKQSAPGEVVALDAYHSQTAGGEMVIGFNTSITEKNSKKFLGALATRVNMDHIIKRVQLLDERSVGHNHAYLLNRRGEIIAGPDEREFLKIHRLHGFPVIQNLLAGRTGISKYSDDRGEDVISATYALKADGSFDGWGWGIIITQPFSEAFKTAYAIRCALIPLIIGLSLLVFLFAIVVSKKFSRPITRVSEAALHISRGEIQPIAIDYDARDEISDLVSAFNKMSQDLHNTTVSRDSLLKEIAERKLAQEKIKHLSRQIINIQEKERESLSREIHDNVGQLLSTLKMALSRVNKKMPDEFSVIKEQMAEILNLVNKTIREIRALSHALHPPLIEDLGIKSAIEELCQDFKTYSEINIRWDIEQIQEPIQSVTKITLYRLFQEGLSNILKHSRASEVYLRLASSGGKIQAVIEDNGVGFSVDEVLSPSQTKSLGLVSMRERVDLIGGELKILSGHGNGTKLIATLEME